MLTKIKSIFSRKNILIVALILSILTVSIGYSALSTTLNISGDMSLRIAADIRITGNRLTRVVDGAYETYNCNYSKDTTINYTTLPATTSVADYEATVTNYSNTRYELKEIIVLNHTNSEEVAYYIEGLTEGDIIEPNTSLNFTIKILPVVWVPGSAKKSDPTETSRLSKARLEITQSEERIHPVFPSPSTEI